MERVKIYMNEAARQLKQFQIQNGGPILMVQVENEYGTWGNDQQYMEQMRDMIRNAGFDKSTLLRCDWALSYGCRK
jgi:beta-galactosidase